MRMKEDQDDALELPQEGIVAAALP